MRTSPPQTMQHAATVPVVFPNLTGRAAPPPRRSIPLQKCLLTYSVPLNILQDRCDAVGVSIDCLSQSIWARLLSQYTGEPEVSFGAFTSELPIPELERASCLCKVWRKGVYTVDVAFSPGKTDEDLRRELGNAPRQNRKDTYETVISVYSSESENSYLATAATDSEFIIHLEILLNTRIDQLLLTLHYDPAFLTGDSALLIAREFLGILTFESEGSGKTPRYSNLQPEILSMCQPSGNAPVDITDQNLFVHHLFEKHAAETPNNSCLEFLHDETDKLETWTFKRLNETSNRIAHLILQSGISRDEAVPVCLDKGPFYYACILACMKAGVPFTPIDPVAPVARKAFMIEELQARYILSIPDRFNELGLENSTKILDISNEKFLEKLSSENPQVSDLTERCLAYRLYTSGSTGQPKAVSLEVGAVVHAIQRSINLLPLHRDTRLLQFAAITFDMCYFDCFLAWTIGFTLISASKIYLLGELEATVKRLQINFLDLTPSVAATLNAGELPEVEMLYCIGEAMPTKIVEDWAGRCVNSYGPTEAAMLCTIRDVKREVKSANFGQPFDGMSLYILDKEAPIILPRMAAGELCICGPQLAREYHRNEAKTASSFITIESGPRLYRTGDLARMLADGTFEFIGRKDDQVKLRGFRIELGEVSAVLRDVHPLIKDVVALVLKHSDEGKEQLVTFLSFSSRKNRLDSPSIQECDAADWDDIERSARKVAEATLPQYMLPHIYFPINWIPLSAAAKVDKRSLGDLFRRTDISTLGRKVEAGASDEEFDEISTKIRHVFAEASNSALETISMDTTIYQLGLDSISALNVARSLKKIGVNASVLDIIECPTIRGLRDHVLSKKNPVSAPYHQDIFASFKQQHIATICNAANVPCEEVTSVLPCSPMQEGILTQFLQSKGSLYYNAILFRLEGGVSIECLEESWMQVAEQNEILRTGFVEHEANGGHYAMITYKALSSSPVRKLQTQLPIEEFVKQMQREEAQKVLSNIALPAWSVTFVPGKHASHMIFTALHAIYDAQTLQILFNDVNLFYHKQQPVLHSNPSTILREMLKLSRDEEAVATAAKYWKSVLQDCPVTKFPVMTPLREDTGEFICSYKRCTVTMKEVEDMCKKAGFSLGSVGQAVWAKLLAMYFGEQDVCFGTVVSGRTGSDNAEDVVFPCLTTIPMRVQIDGDNKALASQIQGKLSKTLKFQHTPLRAIQKALGRPEQSLFDTIFVYQKSTSLREGLKPVWQELDAKATVEYPVSFEIEPTDDCHLGLRLTGRTDIIPQEQMDLMVAQYEYCLLQMLQNQEANAMDLGEVPQTILSDTPAESDKLPSKVRFLHEFVSASTDSHPDKLALEFATAIQGSHVTKMSWTYRQFNDMGNKIANFLLQHGAKTGDLIGICFDKTPQAYFGILGILKAGCAFVALDFSAPIQRRSFIVQDAKVKIVLTMAQFAKDFEGISGLETFSLDNLQQLTRYFSPEEPDVADLAPDNLSYVLYTSGTTGTPKGCRITHDNAVQAMLSFQTLFKGHWDEESRFLQFASLHFDVSVLEQYWSWSVGVCLTCAPRDLIFQDLGNAIRALEITHIDLTPSLARLITPEDCPTLCRGVFITGGEKLKQDVLDAWGEKDVIYNGYGPTEATIGVTMYPRVPKNGRPSNIGPQFVNVGSMVLKPKTMIPVLRGAVGELCVTGALVGDGYLNREDLTQERFPWVNGKRMYRTGDLVRQLHNGCFDYLGRADDQVKLRGQRLELGEINETIRNADKDITEIVTLVCQHGQQQVQQLISFVSFRSKIQGLGASAPAQLLKSFPTTDTRSKILQACRSRLPVYMIPTYVLPMTKLPLTVNNKVDERTLRDLFANTSIEIIQGFEEEEEGVGFEDEELSETENVIRNTLAEVSVDTTSATKSLSFFQLGLDSVSVVGFSNRLRRKGFEGIEVSLIMQNSTIASLANALIASRSPTINEHVQNTIRSIKAFSIEYGFEICSALGLDKEDIESINPCTPLQEGMIARALNSEVPLYYNTFCFQISQNTTPEALRNAWQEVIDRTDILRTCFCETSDGIAQVVLKKSEIRWETLQTSSSDNCLANDHKKQLGMADFATPPVSFEYICGQNSILRLSIFHALYDGTSMPMILSDVESLLSGRQPAKRMQFTKAIPRILSVDTASAKEFWFDHFGGSELGLLEPNNQTKANKEQFLSHTLESPKADVEMVARDLSCTVQSLFQVACLQALIKLLKRQVAMGVITSGRSFTVDGIDSCIGPLFNSIPCHIPIGRGATWKEYAQKAHAFNISSIPFHHTPLRQISKWIGQGSKPLFDVLFVFQPAVPSPNERILHEIESAAIPDYPVALEIQQRVDGRYKISVTTNSAYLNKSETSLLLESIVQGITDILGNPDQEVAVLREIEGDAFTPKSEEETDISQPSTPPPAKFEWTDAALAIRRELATLTEVEENIITGKTSVYQVGLDSVEAIRLSSRLLKKGILLKVSDIMREATIERMIAYLSSLKPQTTSPETSKNTLQRFEASARKALNLSPDDFKNVESILPTTPLQDVMIAECIGSDFALYFNHDVLELEKNVSVQRLQVAWKAVIKKNPILRTTFEEAHNLELGTSTDYIQIVWKDIQLEWDVVETTREHELGRVHELMANHKSRKMPLALGIIRSDGRALMVLSISHALYDGRSMGLLLEDVFREYDEQSIVRPDYKPFLDRVLKQDIKKTIGFWKHFLSDVKPRTFPAVSSDGQVWKAERNSSVSASRFTQFCQVQRISEPVLGQACFGLLLSDIFSQDDVVFGTIVSGTETEESEQFMFPTMNTIPVRAILHGNVSRVLSTMQSSYSRSLDHQFVALRDIQKNVCKPGQRMFDTLFVYQKNRGSDEGIKLWHSIGGASQVEYAIAVEIELSGDSLTWRISASSKNMSSRDTEDILGTLDAMLQKIIEEPQVSYQQYTSSQLGKTMRGRLHSEVAHNSEIEMSAPKSENYDELERQVINAISVVSRSAEHDIKPSTSIFHLGIDSISAIRLASELRKRSIFIAVSDILRESTVRKICLYLDNKQQSPSPSEKPATRPEISQMQLKKIVAAAGLKLEDVEYASPATAGQLFLIRAWESSEGRIFLPTFSFRSIEALRSPRLKGALDRLVKSNPILRTSFGTDGGEIFQVVHKSASPSFRSTYFDSDSVPKSSLHQINQEEQVREYDINTPSIRLHLVSSQKESYVFVTLHHALYDAFTLPTLLSQLSDLYKDERLALPRPEKPLAIASSSKTKEFWTKYLANSESTALVAKANMGVKERVGLYIEKHVPNGLKIDAACRKHGISLHALSIACFGQALSKMVHNDSPIFGVYISNRHLSRDSEGAQTTPTLNMVPLMVKGASQSPVVDLAKQVHEDLLKISTSDAATTNLMEIYQWTGVRIDSFINFLKEDRLDGNSRDGGLFERVELSAGSSIEREFSIPGSLRSKDSIIQTNLDIELALRDGFIDVGLFATKKYLDEVDLRKISEEIREGLVHFG